jgi:hypothetical protein
MVYYGVSVGLLSMNYESSMILFNLELCSGMNTQIIPTHQLSYIYITSPKCGYEVLSQVHYLIWVDYQSISARYNYHPGKLNSRETRYFPVNNRCAHWPP